MTAMLNAFLWKINYLEKDNQNEYEKTSFSNDDGRMGCCHDGRLRRT